MDNDYVVIVDSDLYHHGIIGMKWGRRRYQNKDGSLTAAGKKRYADEMEKVQAETKKVKAEQRAKARTAAKISKLEQAKQELKELKSADKAKRKAEQQEKKKDKNASKTAEVESDADKKARLLREPTPSEVLANRRLFSDNEINAINLRLANEQKIAAMEPKKLTKGEEFVEKFTHTSTLVTSVVTSGSNLWNSVAKVSNSLFDTELPLITDKVKTKLDKYKEETEWVEAKNKRKKAMLDDPDREKSELEKTKDQADMQEAKNRLAKAKNDDPTREKSDDEKYAAETARIENQWKRQKAENNRRDAELDAEGLNLRATKTKDAAEKYAAEKADAENAAKKKAAEDKANADTKAKQENETRSREEYEKSRTNTKLPDSPEPDYRSGVGEKTRTGAIPNNLAMSIYKPNSPAVSMGKSHVRNDSETGKLSTNVVSKIHSMTNSGNKSYAEIASQLGVSTSTVQKYSKGRDTAYELLDRNGNSVMQYD